MSEDIVLPKITEEEFRILNPKLCSYEYFENALNLVKNIFKPSFCEEHVYPVVDLVIQYFGKKELIIEEVLKEDSESPWAIYLVNIAAAAAIHDVEEQNKLNDSSVQDFIDFYVKIKDKKGMVYEDDYIYLFMPTMRKPLKNFDSYNFKILAQANEHVERLNQKQQTGRKIINAAAFEAKVIAIADRICELPYLIARDKKNLEEHLRANHFYIDLSENLSIFKGELEDLSIKGYSILSNTFKGNIVIS